MSKPMMVILQIVEFELYRFSFGPWGQKEGRGLDVGSVESTVVEVEKVTSLVFGTVVGTEEIKYGYK